MVMVLAPLVPGLTLRLAGVADNVKLGGGVMVSEIVTLLVRLPEAPVTVTVAVPAAVALAALSVRVLCIAVEFGPKEAVTPAGRPLAERPTAALNPFCPFTVMVLLPFPPGLTLRLAGNAESVKLGGAVMVSAIVVLPTVVPEVPVTVTVVVPGVAFTAALNVSVLVRVAAAGLKLPVTPAGSPVTEKVTEPLNPFCGVTVIVLAPVPPSRTVTLAGDAESV
jgi:hypothetical protein